MRTFSRILLAATLFLFSALAIAGDVQKGRTAYENLDYATALSEWQDLADSGNAKAAFGLGTLYGNGFGVDMNDDLALKYYGIAAEKGHAEAQFNLAVMHQNGWGVPPDEEVANEWYSLAAEQGITDAQMALGRYYSMDFLDSFDPIEAYKWFSVAARLGDFDAGTKRDFMASRMTAEQLSEADARISDWVGGHETLFADN